MPAVATLAAFTRTGRKFFAVLRQAFPGDAVLDEVGDSVRWFDARKMPTAQQLGRCLKQTMRREGLF